LRRKSRREKLLKKHKKPRKSSEKHGFFSN